MITLPRPGLAGAGGTARNDQPGRTAPIKTGRQGPIKLRQDAMKGFKDKSFSERLSTAAEAKQAKLKLLLNKPAADDPAVLRRNAERQAIAAAREIRAAERAAAKRAEQAREAAAAAELAARQQREAEEREAARRAEEAREAAEQVERAAREQREAAEKAEQAAALAAAQKAARDARYAARKARK